MKEMALVHGFVWSKDGDVDAHDDVINPAQQWTKYTKCMYGNV